MVSFLSTAATNGVLTSNGRSHVAGADSIHKGHVEIACAATLI